MELPVTSPSNRFLVSQRDRRWHQALSALLVGSVVVLALLVLLGWPRLRSTSIDYQLIRLRAEVEDLARTERRLTVELEQRRAPAALAERAEALGLAPPPAAAVAAEGR